jgi:hypothetical protein
VERGQDVHRVLDDMDEAISEDARIFQRGGELVIARGVLAEDAKRLRIKFASGTIILAQLRPSSLLPRITEHVDYGYWGFKEKEGDDGKTEKVRVWKTDLPSALISSAFLSKVFWAHIRPIRGIAATPIIHLDGSIVSEGYDPATQYYVASNVALPPIPDRPTPDDAKTALAALLEPFAEFPFETDDERYSPVALALTLLLRPVIVGNVPAFVQTAPQKNCGKSLATKAACLLATGQIPASNTWAKEGEEQEKMIGSAADAGAPVLFFDNVPEGNVIGGAPLDKVLTCDGANSFRVLGASKLKSLPWETTIAFTANRARIGGDTDRRVVLSTLIRPDVPPEKFSHDLLPYIAAERPRLLAAAFTLARAWVQAGARDAEIRRLDSFEHWARTVAAMIKWAGGGDVRELVRDVEGTDKDGTELALLEGMHAWLILRGKTDVTVKALLADVFSQQATAGGDPTIVQALREAIEGIAGFQGKGDDRKLDARKFGNRLAAMKDLLQGSYRLKRTGETSGLARWTVVKVTPAGGSGGSRGVDPDCTRAHVERSQPQCQLTPLVALDPPLNGYPPSWDMAPEHGEDPRGGYPE